MIHPKPFYQVMTSGFISSIEESLSNAPLLMSGLVRCSQEVKKYYNFHLKEQSGG